MENESVQGQVKERIGRLMRGRRDTGSNGAGLRVQGVSGCVWGGNRTGLRVWILTQMIPKRMQALI